MLRLATSAIWRSALGLLFGWHERCIRMAECFWWMRSVGMRELADSVNHLLVVGFYLINIGYIALALRTESPMTTFRQIIELESVKIGVVLLILGAMHFFNILVFAKMRNRAAGMVPPPPPNRVIPAVQH